ncbi:DUF5406 family protein [Enterococcus faecalis]|uniref:DUF5406 family protein n=1 Tax=Enterococcus faecalis TaxID=1351 RepID=UPI003CC7A273
MRYSPAGISKKFSQIVSEVLTQIQNDKKDELLVEDVWEELSEYIVRIEIIDFEEEK